MMYIHAHLTVFLFLAVQPKTPTMLVSPTPPIFDGSSITINCTSDSETLMTGGFTVTLLRTNNGVGTVISSVNVSTSTSYTTTVSASHAGDYSCKIAYRGVDSLSSAVTSVSGEFCWFTPTLAHFPVASRF